MSQLLMVSLRTHGLGASVAQAEYNDVIRSTGLKRDDLDHVVILDETYNLPDLSQYAGIIVGGSSLNITDSSDPAEYSSYQKHVHSLLASLAEQTIPVFLICFGASWLAYHSGGSVSHTWGEDSGGSLIELSDNGKQDVLCAGLPFTFQSMTGHTEAIETVNENLVVLATGPTCPFQLLRYKDTVWASQFHCEMDAQALQTRMDFYKDYGYFAPEDYDAIVASLPGIDPSAANQLLANFVDFCVQRA